MESRGEKDAVAQEEQDHFEVQQNNSRNAHVSSAQDGPRSLINTEKVTSDEIIQSNSQEANVQQDIFAQARLMEAILVASG